MIFQNLQQSLSKKIQLQQIQIENLQFLFNLNQQIKQQSFTTSINANQNQEFSDELYWKILIFDKYCQEILSPLFKVGNLRDQNITLHLNISSKRDQLFGVKAIYFIQPTEENIQLLKQDFSKDLYEQVYINFSYKLPPNFEDKLADELAQTNAINRIKQVYVHDLNYVSLNQDLFTLNISNVYSIFNKINIDEMSESNMESTIDYITTSLYSIFKSSKTIPFIFYFAEGLGYIVAKKLQQLFEQLMETKQFEEEKDNYYYNQQPSLILLERNIDLMSGMLQPWHYGALIYDQFEIKNNKIQIQLSEKEKKQEFDLDPQTDDYWRDQQKEEIQQVQTSHQNYVQKWKQDKEEMGHQQLKKNDVFMHEQMSMALSKVPEMTERKKRLDLHTNLLTQIDEEITKRELDKCHVIGKSIIFKQFHNSQYKQILLEYFQSVKCTLEDCIKLLIILYLESKSQIITSLEKPDFEYINQLEKIAQAKNNNKEIASISYIKEKFAINQQQEKLETSQIPKLEAVSQGKKEKGIQLLKGFASKVKSHGQGLLQNISNKILLDNKYYTVSKLVESIIENRATEINSKIRTLDLLSKAKQKKQQIVFENNFVFLIDGGNYNEYLNLSELAKNFGKNIIYGSSCIYNSKQLLLQFTQK